VTYPIDVTFHGIPRSEWIEDEIRIRAGRLDSCCPRILSCRVVIDRPHRHHQEGNRFRVRIDIAVPGGEIAVSHESNLYGSQKDSGAAAWLKQFEVEAMRKDLRLVIREAFAVARRRVQAFSERRREIGVTATARRRPVTMQPSGARA
jgi:hypothetical protein